MFVGEEGRGRGSWERRACVRGGFVGCDLVYDDMSSIYTYDIWFKISLKM